MSIQQQKAKEIFEKYYLSLRESSNEYDQETARQCAIIMVNEIIGNAKATLLYHKDSNAIPVNIQYWEDVLNHLNEESF